jgi:hypothetical protein
MLALAMAAALIVVPIGAQADTDGTSTGVAVCNTANSSGGNLSVDSLDPQAPVHNNSGMRAKGNGNMNAAMHSRALSLCSVPTEDVTVPDSVNPVPTGPSGNNG